ncbi:hypothetical protein KFL_008210040 [Klebsormidium nitens]|uniref:Uncharacterized protein n=1 Tax=Klebsormidium nitens TaxID=105231 RepID=A0A1Y1IS92_KLENI|nr:hypothetical protein KFL_008210040 [Klebsormidium nitens]|eukprot:GAQ91626.1 hypothetical protein KFL_008210040 [Klebsormidium nitens]
MVFEFTPSGETVCWDAKFLLIRMETRRISEGVDFFRHPIHNCKVDDLSAELVHLVAERSGKEQKVAMRKMLKHVLKAAAANVAFFIGASSYVVWRHDFIQALENLGGGPDSAYFGGLGVGMSIGVVALAAAQSYGPPIAREHNECEDPESVGEELYTVGILKYKTASKAARPKVPTGLYLLFFNMGGRCITWQFLARRRKRSDVILGLDNKPKNWMDCKEFAWRPEDSKEIPRDIFE